MQSFIPNLVSLALQLLLASDFTEMQIIEALHQLFNLIKRLRNLLNVIWQTHNECETKNHLLKGQSSFCVLFKFDPFLI